MVSGRLKSRTYKRIAVKTPGGVVKTHYRRRKPAKAHCSECKKVLSGVMSDLPVKMQNTAKTKKVPSRPYAGNLCSTCARNKIKAEARLGE